MAAQGHRPGLQPHPRCRHDAGRHGPVCRWHDHAAQHRKLARQGDRPHRGHDQGAAQAGRRSRGRRGLHPRHTTRIHRRMARGQHPHLRRSPRGHVLLAGGLQPGRPAGAHRRPQVRRQDLPRLLRGPVLGLRDRPCPHPRDLHRWPHRLRQRNHRRRGGRGPGLPPAGLGRAVPPHRTGRVAGRHGAGRIPRPADCRAGARAARAL